LAVKLVWASGESKVEESFHSAEFNLGSKGCVLLLSRAEIEIIRHLFYNVPYFRACNGGILKVPNIGVIE